MASSFGCISLQGFFLALYERLYNELLLLCEPIAILTPGVLWNRYHKT